MLVLLNFPDLIDQKIRAPELCTVDIVLSPSSAVHNA